MARSERLVELSIGRIFHKELKRDIAWQPAMDEDRLVHIIDWIVSSNVNGASWIGNVDEQGRPKKLMKAGSLEVLFREAEKYMAHELSKRTLIGSGPDDIEVFSDDGGDYVLVKLLTPDALKFESGFMRHCVGHGAYDGYLGEEERLLLSLRDRGGRPHVTVELHEGFVIQSRGRANSEPKEVYAEAVERLLGLRGLPLRSTPDLTAEIGLDMIWPVGVPRHQN